MRDSQSTKCPVRGCQSIVPSCRRICDTCFRRLPRRYQEPLCQSDNSHRDAMLRAAVTFLDHFGTDETRFRSAIPPASNLI